jgi:CheY-like chemotaxis protein
MPDIFAPVLGPTHTVICTSQQVMAEVAAALAFNGCVLFVVMPTGDGYEVTVRADQRRTLDAAFMAASNLLTPRLPVVSEDAHLEQAYEDRVSGAGSD